MEHNAAPTDQALSAAGWSPMPEKEARRWCNTWGIGLDDGSFDKWTPRIETPNDQILPRIAEAVQSVWEYLKSIRAPCMSTDGHPAIWLNSRGVVEPNANAYDGRYEEDRAPMYEYHVSVHDPVLPSIIKVGDPPVLHPNWPEEINIDIERVERSNNISGLILANLRFTRFDEFRICQQVWQTKSRDVEHRPRCPNCGDFGTGFGVIRNERRFFHERNRSCYIGVVENRLKRNPLVKCAKCGEMGREHRGKDGHIRVRHANRVCYIE